ncbi:MAG: hypothetical protein IPM48_14565 [Saprospiraceae bacterium]|nr:hypothetical protein [Saprospiraceae bacterium]
MDLSEIKLQEAIVFVLGIIALIKFIVEFYRAMTKPNTDQDKELALLKASIAGINVDITSIKNNHIAHIEKDVRDLQIGQERIITILDERLPKK